MTSHLLTQGHQKQLAVRDASKRAELDRQATILRAMADTEAAISADTVLPPCTSQHDVVADSGYPDAFGYEGSAVFDDILRKYAFNPTDFAMRLEKDAAVEQVRLMDAISNFGLWDATQAADQLDRAAGVNVGEVFGFIKQNDEGDDTLTNVLQSLNIEDHLDGDDIVGMASGGQYHLPKDDAKWFPYESKLMFLLDILDNLPRMRISSSLMRVILWILKESGVRNVPSLYHLRQAQASLRRFSSVPTHQFKSAHGNVYYMNDVRTLVAKDYSNPLVRPHLKFYPEVPDGPVSEIWHAEKWRKDMDLSMLTPMYARGYRHFYVGELASLYTGELVMPIRWVLAKGTLHADAFRVAIDAESGNAFVYNGGDETVFISTEDLQMNFLDLRDTGKVPTLTYQDGGAGPQMPNPLRVLADGDPLYSSFVDLFGDDQEFHVHFLSTSPNASITEQIEAFKDMIESTHTKPIRVRNALSRGDACVRIFLNAEPSDNPMQSELTGYMGGKSNCFCRKCKVGGTQAEKAEDDQYDQLFKPGEPRTAAETLHEVVQQVSKACTGIAAQVEERQTRTGVKDSYTQRWIVDLIARARNLKAERPDSTIEEIHGELMQWVGENQMKLFNPNLRIKGFDPSKDTPVEILHTILLGVTKYAWYHSHSTWSSESKKTYALRLQATDVLGLTIPPIRANYIMQYANSLIGRQLKTVGQTSVFHIYDLVSDELLQVWKAVGVLMALLWTPEIDDMETYTNDVKTAAANVMDLFAILDPTKIISKVKLHLLPHLPEDIRRFGPLLGVETEIYECFNAIFRFCSIFSNHLAPSRDIAQQLANQEGLKHRVTGGWWPTEDGQGWVQQSAQIRDFLAQHPTLQNHIGWTPHADLRELCGTVRFMPLNHAAAPCEPESAPPPAVAAAGVRGNFCLWKDTHSSTAINAAAIANERTAELRLCKSCVADSGDWCAINSWVFARSPTSAGEVIIGCVIEILAHANGENGLACLDVFQVASERHDVFDMPRLTRRLDEQHILDVLVTDILFIFNVQHDCRTAKCTATGIRAVPQERMDSDRTETYIQHQPLEEYIVNIHALHNCHLVRRLLPRALTQPLPLFEDEGKRREKHCELAAELHDTLGSRAAKRKQKRACPDGDSEAHTDPAISRACEEPATQTAPGEPGGGRPLRLTLRAQNEASAAAP
ncbi:hypothetical protein OF83DRAFT_1179230 [Amylostereum chailletii]|nr:hypothetical protein OF83DRAFT_1179230 [Amylostereum chailletii]